MNMLVGARFRVGKKIGSGAFGDVHLGRDILTEDEVRLKGLRASDTCSVQQHKQR